MSSLNVVKEMVNKVSRILPYRKQYYKVELFVDAVQVYTTLIWKDIFIFIKGGGMASRGRNIVEVVTSLFVEEIE
jgi:hypothetical protein